MNKLKHGSSCKSSDQCLTSRGLACVNSICSCRNPDDAWNPSQSNCSKSPFELNWAVRVLKSPWFWLTQVKAALLNETCDNERVCNVKHNLVCQDRICTCAENMLLRDSECGKIFFVLLQQSWVELALLRDRSPWLKLSWRYWFSSCPISKWRRLWIRRGVRRFKRTGMFRWSMRLLRNRLFVGRRVERVQWAKDFIYYSVLDTFIPNQIIWSKWREGTSTRNVWKPSTVISSTALFVWMMFANVINHLTSTD